MSESSVKPVEHPPSIEWHKYPDRSVELLFQACLQKFLTYALIGAALFIGYIPLALQDHGESNPGAHLFLSLAALLLTAIIAAAATAAGYQYYLIAALESSDVLRLKGLERQVVAGASPLIVNAAEVIGGIKWSATKRKTATILTLVVLLLWFVLLFVLFYAVT